MPELKDSMNWQWCSSCQRWHPRGVMDKIHGDFSAFVSSIYQPKQAPASENFDGTSDELERFITGYRLRQEDRLQALVEFEHRIDLELKRRANA